MKAETTRIAIAARDLRPVLTGLGKVVARKAALPALQCIRVTTGRTAAELCGTDLDGWASVRLAKAASGDPATFLVAIDALRDAVKRTKAGDPIAMSLQGDRVAIAAGAFRRTVSSPKLSDYPSPPSFTGKAHVLPNGARRAVIEALRCASTDESRYVLHGVHLDTSGKKGHHVIGTDGRHLYTANSFTLPFAKPAILGSNPLLHWKPVAEASEWKLRLSRDKGGNGGAFEVTADAWRIVGRMIDGNYPSWRQVVPDERGTKSRVRFAPETITRLAGTVAKLPVYSASGNLRVTVCSDGKAVTLQWRDADEARPQELPIPDAKPTGKPFAISLNRPYLAKALTFGLGELQVTDEMTAARFADDTGRQMIVMPLRPTGPPSARPAEKPATKTRTRTTKPTMPSKEPSREPPAATADAPIDAALQELAKVRDTLREAAGGLQSAAAKLRQAKQTQRATEKDVRTVRSTLASLRKLRL